MSDTGDETCAKTVIATVCSAAGRLNTLHEILDEDRNINAQHVGCIKSNSAAHPNAKRTVRRLPGL